MRIERRIIVFDAADIEAEGRFWAAIQDGEVVVEDDWVSVVVDGEWIMGVQRAPEHAAPNWAAGEQQVHVDLHVDDLEAYRRRAIELGATELAAPRAPADNPDGSERFVVLASPAGHPFCFGSH